MCGRQVVHTTHVDKIAVDEIFSTESIGKSVCVDSLILPKPDEDQGGEDINIVWFPLYI
jgi:hypothetical protein